MAPLAVVAVLFLATSCLSGTESIVTDVSPRNWNEPALLQYSNTDTITLKEMRLTLRHSEVLERTAGLYTVETIFPSGIAVRDTISIEILPDTQTNRLGEALARIGSTRLAEIGDYRFIVRPLQNTVGVWSVGIEMN